MTAATHQALPIGLQLYTVRDEFEKEGADKTLAAISAMGYRNVELAGTYGHTPAEFKALLEKYHLKAISAHISLVQMLNSLDDSLEEAKLFGYRHCAIPFLPVEYRSIESIKTLAPRLKQLVECFRAEGITLMWHNHDFEFYPLPSGELLEDLLLQTGLNIEMDLFWLVFAGQKPLEWMDRYRGRVSSLHMKDMTPSERKFTEVGAGILDLSLYAHEGIKQGVEFLVVEQDANWTISPLESARLGFENLNKLLTKEQVS